MIDYSGWLAAFGGFAGLVLLLSTAYHNYVIRKAMREQAAALKGINHWLRFEKK